MAETIPQLENPRVRMVRDTAGWGDFRRGSITSITGRCAALTPMAALRITGRAAGRLLPPNSNFHVAHPY